MNLVHVGFHAMSLVMTGSHFSDIDLRAQAALPTFPGPSHWK